MGCLVIVCALEEMCVENVVSLHRGLFYAIQCIFPFVIWFGRGATQSFQITALVNHCALCVPVAVNFNVKIMTLFWVTRVDRHYTAWIFISASINLKREKWACVSNNTEAVWSSLSQNVQWSFSRFQLVYQLVLCQYVDWVSVTGHHVIQAGRLSVAASIGQHFFGTLVDT